MGEALLKQRGLILPERRLLVPDRRILHPRDVRSRIEEPTGWFPFPMITPAYVVTPGSIGSGYGPGTYSVTLPRFNSITFQLWGAGGGAGGTGAYANNRPGANGGSSYLYLGVATLFAGGGNGGANGYTNNDNSGNTYGGANGGPGTASGGTTNTTGGGEAGQSGMRFYNAANGGTSGYHFTGTGGAGGYTSISYTYGGPGVVPGATITVVLGAGGAAGVIGYPNYTSENGDRGPTVAQNAQFLISWS